MQAVRPRQGSVLCFFHGQFSCKCDEFLLKNDDFLAKVMNFYRKTGSHPWSCDPKFPHFPIFPVKNERNESYSLLLIVVNICIENRTIRLILKNLAGTVLHAGVVPAAGGQSYTQMKILQQKI